MNEKKCKIDQLLISIDIVLKNKKNTLTNQRY